MIFYMNMKKEADSGPDGLSYDLHSHSICSDGVLSPAEVVRRARANGVDVLALTDHDSTDGLVEAHAAARECGLALVPGVEVSVTWGKQLIHIVALAIDPAYPALRSGLERQRQLRHERAVRIADKLDRLGIAGSLEGASRQAAGAAPGRNHFARFLVEQGHVRDLRQAFKRYLGHGGECHVPCCWASLDEALDWIHAAGGRAVLAHPGRYGMTRSALRRFLAAFRDARGDAIEVISGSQTPDQTRAMAEHAREYGLLASMGSDFHAPGQGWAELGVLPRLPGDCIPVWHDWDVALRGAIEADTLQQNGN